MGTFSSGKQSSLLTKSESSLSSLASLLFDGTVRGLPHWVIYTKPIHASESALNDADHTARAQ